MVGHKAQNVSAKPRTRDIQVAEDTDFKSMLLPQPILNGLQKSGYIKPSPIQKKALPLVRCGLDLVIQAKAGTGKTCVFTVAVLELVKPSLPHLQAIILAPTREIALQITSVIKAIGQCIEGLKVDCFIGGYPLSVDVDKVKGCHVVVAAPGRLKHLLEKGMLNPRHVRLFVLDEADKLMEKVFINDIDAIFAHLPESKQVLASSATYTDQLVDFLTNYMNSGQFVSPYDTVNPTVLLGVRQFVSIIPKHVDRLAQLKLKEKHLLYLLQSVSFNQCLVFSNLHTRAVSLCGMLRGDGWGVEWIAGRQDQKARVAAMTSLRDQKVRVLVTTDLTARGIDVENVNLVINLDLPGDHHTYLHRMGRAGRYGSHGIVITVVCDGQELTAFQKIIGLVGGSEQTANRVPQSLKYIDLWTMSDDKFEKISGIVENPSSSISPSSTGEKYSPESSDSEDYVKEYKRENVLESSDSEDYVKEYKGNVEQSNVIYTEGNHFDVPSGDAICEMSINEVKNFEEARVFSLKNMASTSDKSVEYTSTDEKISPESSEEGYADSCVCDLYEANAADVKVVAGPSLFALKKEDHWHEVLPVIVNESKVPLNTPIALLDSKLIRVRFWDRTKKIMKKLEVHTPIKELIDFDSKSEEKNLLSFKDITSLLENGFDLKTSTKDEEEGKNMPILTFEKIEELLKGRFSEGDKNDLAVLFAIKETLLKYQALKESSENALISFDSFDLVGWLAVDKFHNIIEKVNIDECEVFMFKLVNCLAGKNHIEVLTPIKGSSKETNDYIDHITTLNVEGFHLQTVYSLSDIAQQMKNVTSKMCEELPGKVEPGHKVVKSTSERLVSETSLDTKEKTSQDNSFKVPTVNNNGKKCNNKKIASRDVLDVQRKREPSSYKSAVNFNASKSNNQRNTKNIRSSASIKNEGKIVSENKNKIYKDQVKKCDEFKKDSEYVSVASCLSQCKPKDTAHQASTDSDNSSDSGPYVDMTWKHTKVQPSGVASTENRSLQESLGAKSKVNTNNSKHLNSFGHPQKHRNSDDSYDSFDTVEYETTDLDKELLRALSENCTQSQHHHTNYQDFMDKSNHPTSSAKSKVLHSKQERSRTHVTRYKQSHLEIQDTHPCVESENIKPQTLVPKQPSYREPKNKKKNSYHFRPQNFQDTEESYKESSDNCKSIETEISKLRELNLKIQSRGKQKKKHHSNYKHKQVDDGSGDSSFESAGTNRHSFRTACSRHSEDEEDSVHGFMSNSSSRSGNNCFENHCGIPLQTGCNKSRNGRWSRGESSYKNTQRTRGREEECFQEQGFSQNLYCQVPYGAYYADQFGAYSNAQDQEYSKNVKSNERFEPSHTNEFVSYENDYTQFQQTDFSNMASGGESKVVRGENLQQEWYSNWYLRVRQRAMQLAMMEYTREMSTP